MPRTPKPTTSPTLPPESSLGGPDVGRAAAFVPALYREDRFIVRRGRRPGYMQETLLELLEGSPVIGPFFEHDHDDASGILWR
jgi:hypothetical protein